MIFKEKFTTRWHDTDAYRRVRATQMLVYMQEVSNHHMESCGMSLDRLRDSMGLAFILSKIRMRMYRPLYAFEDIEVQTWTCEGRGYAISRFYRIMRGDEIIADADTTWALVSLTDRSLVRQEDFHVYDFENEPTVAIDVPARLRFPKDVPLESVGQRRIVYSDLDYNMHMNNTKYPDMLCDFMPSDEVERIRGIYLSYVHEAAFGDTLDVRSAICDGIRYFRTVGSEGNTCLEAAIILE
ncbi:MAG: hypothetical protein IJY08_01095 [Clostridia bacterium]|nr:hypothetical protein [Clostridia bacterium]